jgi:hypothetical protein
MRWWFCGLGVMVIVSCGGTQEVLEVKQFHLRKTETNREENEVVRGEKLKRLHGAVSATERRERLGHYYTVHWAGPSGRESEPVRLELDYQQAATGSKVISLVQELAGTAQGSTEFQVTGPAYQKGGRVLAWQVRLYRGGELVGTRRSYLWD